MGVVRKPYLPSVISAPSREAKRIGINTGMLTSEAMRIYRDFKVILEDPEKYVYASSQVFRILREFSAWVKVMSIDEGWADITQITNEKYGGDPRVVAQAIKQRIRLKLGPIVTASIGIAPSKLLSKYAGELCKPDGLVWIKEENVGALLKELEVDAVCGINKGYKRRLNGLGIRTLADLGQCPIYKLRRLFGIWGYYLHLMGQGTDSPMLEIEYVGRERKGYSHSRVLRASEHFTYGDLHDNEGVLHLLCKKVARRMRSDGKVGRVVYFHVTSKVGLATGKQSSLPYPSNDEEVFFRACLAIAQELIKAGQYVAELDGIGVHVSNLSNIKDMTVPLFLEDRQRQALLNAIDDIEDTYGEMAIHTLGVFESARNFNWNAQNRGMYRELDRYDYN